MRRYKPRVITLTIGGNDVGFSEKIRACANPLRLNNTCDIATESGRLGLAKELKNQYKGLKGLYEELYKASGNQAKIYVLGYPQFINGGHVVSCGANIGALNIAERRMIYNAVELMNSVIEQAAKAAGVKYIDIEDSLEGGRLCDEGQAYMTGIAGVGGSEMQESFHPNAKGHHRMAMKLWDEVNNESLLGYDICPSSSENICPDVNATEENITLPPYFAGEGPPYLIEYASHMTSGSGTKGAPINVVRTSYSFSPSGIVEVTLFSDPVGLGQFTAEGDGSLSVDIQIPASVPAGYHTLALEGTTYSGEPIRYEQIILVQGANPDDLDDNGIPDSQQPRGPFMVASGIDADLDGIDDACDPHISEAPELYRAWLGEDNLLYVERNTRASGITGVIGDHSLSGDGWAIVGASRDGELDGMDIEQVNTRVDFEVLGDGSSDNPYSPVVYIYSADEKCTAYRPVSLSVVMEGESRGLVHVKISNDRCYQDLSGDDDDTGPGDAEEPIPPDEEDPSGNEPSPINQIKKAIQTVASVIGDFVRAIVNAVVTKLQTFVVSFRW